ncbi:MULTISPECIES: PAP/fibrillin family protein [Leptolyngbya]|uniref:PAP/fibrillin family protein n=1 Tax=Leptolyngbya boryana CZ1 TaxID=3060204 RepID=A0AA97AN30_LEPBY|nr:MULTISPECIES: PAP/fibrillin family protein [Leptolyngbya]MBD1859777.1 PAP/fibrillin family protein [Leptolyngbya sp. FACHB-1624]MBN8559471.1 PAP/fibrillin family protein [Leptolyngbya sp. UWPOB_LEPTO1]MCY6491939.1 PAP/fibrillin family protein [Leptolyngbya sp. GGD]WNZ44677.1 PAP/fibrillin family protein [Leptolyngbya boryana CZ1]
MIGKAALLEAIAGTNRGILASESEKQAILAAIAQLEDRNPTPRPLEAIHLLDGNWRLIYTTSRGILGIDQFPLLKLGQVYQCIHAPEAKLYNIAEVSGVPFLEGIVAVVARFRRMTDRRVDVKFERSFIGLQRLIDYQSPSYFIQQLESEKKFAAIDFQIKDRDQQGWLDVTYLDEDLRIGRGNEGSVFVLTKN